MEEAEEGAAVVEAEVFAEAEDGAGLGHKEDPLAPQKLVFALIAEQLRLISWDCPVFVHGALIVVRR